MQFTLITIFSVLFTFVSANPINANAARSGGNCNTGSMTCCNSVQDACSPQAMALLSKVGVESVTGQVGIGCSPVSVLSAGGSSCSASPVCCENNSFNGVIALGCVNLNL